MIETMPESEARSLSAKREARGLLLVGLFKYSKAIFFGLLTAGALHLLHRNVGDMALSLVDALRIDPEGHFASFLMDKADLIDNHQLRQAGAMSCAYACVCVVEGTGLILQKVWAEYFTVILTVGALPYEVYEILREFTWLKAALIAMNVAVLFYLLWLLRRKRRREAESGFGVVAG